MKRVKMPKPTKLDRCVSAVKKQGKAESASYAICNASLNKKKKTKTKGK